MPEKVRIATFNVNSIRSRLQIVLDWFTASNCDVLCVQEIKVTNEDFPAGAFSDAGLCVAFNGQKTYNGVALISREPMETVECGLGSELFDQEARVISGVYKGITIFNTYIPQGTAVGTPRFDYKINFLRGLGDVFRERFSPDDYVIWAGDMNVARLPIDVYDPEGLAGSVCFHPDEHAAIDYATQWGMRDVLRVHHADEADLYSFWDYRIPNAVKRRMGWRLDYIFATDALAQKSVDSFIDKEPRLLEKPSDHTPVVADFEVG